MILSPIHPNTHKHWPRSLRIWVNDKVGHCVAVISEKFNTNDSTFYETFGHEHGVAETISDKTKPDVFYMGLIDESNLPSSCPKCKNSDHSDENQRLSHNDNSLKGPFTRYQRRETELYFDLKEKYLTCPNCGSEITVIDFQVLVDEIAATLPHEEARAFSMKIMGLYSDSRDYAIEVLSILTGDLTMEQGRGNDYLKELEKLIQAPHTR